MQTHVYLCSNTLQKNLQRKQRDNFYLKKKSLILENNGSKWKWALNRSFRKPIISKLEIDDPQRN